MTPIAHHTGKPHTSAAIADTILQGFNRHYALFRAVCQQARVLFEARNFVALRNSVRERIAFYDARVRETSQKLIDEFQAEALPDALWSQIKRDYIALLNSHLQPELAETFFNSVCCRILHRSYFHNEFIFFRPAVATDYLESDPPLLRSYYPQAGNLYATLRQALSQAGFALPFADLDGDVRRVVRAFRRYAGHLPRLDFDSQLELLAEPFFRSRGAYLLGRLRCNGRDYPFALALYHCRDGAALQIDAALFDPIHIRQLFSMSRAYFLIDSAVPSALVRFLHTLIPEKSPSELYTMIGLGKQGKTMFYRELMHHLHQSSDRFQFAPGIKGMVMIVFALPSFPYVFKVIKDVFAPPKEVSRQVVREKYQLVKEHDRVGRMADSLEFSNVALPRARIAPELLDELQRLAPSMVEIEADTVVIRHVYIECRMQPLNMFLDTQHGHELEEKVRDYGNALRELAIANIFPGDMLFKNFGITRTGRVVFYDYDEIEYMTDCDFRRIPPPPSPEFEMSGEAWYTGNKGEVYPEEFGTFLLTHQSVRQAFLKYHRDLLTPEFWQQAKARIQAGVVEEFYPYPASARFATRG